MFQLNKTFKHVSNFQPFDRDFSILVKDLGTKQAQRGKKKLLKLGSKLNQS